jgi:hypothetical protein
MRQHRNTLGPSPKGDFTSLAAWSAYHAGETADVNVLVVARDHIEEYESQLASIAALIDTPSLFVSDTGRLLSYVARRQLEPIEPNLLDAFAGAPSPDGVDQIVEAFLEERFGQPADTTHAEVKLIVKSMAAALAGVLARDPNALDSVEWRQLEQVLAEVFGALGFEVTLTPPAKDGGKDLILQCAVTSEARTYLVEVKHWTSGKRVGPGEVERLIEVVVRGGRAGGLVLSSSGFSSAAQKMFLSLERRKVIGGEKTAIITLCRLYATSGAGVLAPSDVWDYLVSAGKGDRSDEAT